MRSQGCCIKKIKILKKILKKTPFFSLILYWRRRKIIAKEAAHQNQVIQSWKLNGRPLPAPQCYKRLVIKEYANKYAAGIFIETGTYVGETLDSFKNVFKKLISI